MIVGLVLRHLLTRGIRFVLVHKVSTVLVMILGAALLMASLGRIGGTSIAQASNSAMVPPAPATERYMEGNRTFNAQLIWDALSEDLHTMANTRGESVASLQERLDSTRESGGQVLNSAYIGGFVPSDGEPMYFYVMTMANPKHAEQPQHVFYVFRVGPDGKITSIE